jgi:hypothetical protein
MVGLESMNCLVEATDEEIECAQSLMYAFQEVGDDPRYIGKHLIGKFDEKGRATGVRDFDTREQAVTCRDKLPPHQRLICIQPLYVERPGECCGTI